MPKDTFMNLPEDKRQRIFEASVDEFAEKRFSDASINSIIKAAGIPRGSFYQYFSDKEDLYLYTLGEIGKEKIKIVMEVGRLEPEADFFEVYEHMFKVGIKWAEKHPRYSRIGLLMKLDDSGFIAKLKAVTDDGLKQLEALIDRDKERGLIAPDIDSRLVVNLLYNSISQDVQELFEKGNEAELMERVKKTIRIIKGGITIVQGR